MNGPYALILGARGSVPLSAPEFASFGGATVSVLVRLAGRYFVLDAGTGIMRLPREVTDCGELTLLLSHVHLDHLNGLAMCPFVLRAGNTLDIYASPGDGSSIGDVLRKLYSPPVWPFLPEQFPAKLRFHPLPERLELDGVTVTTLDGVHPGGVKLIRLDGEGKRVVFATDCTLTDAVYPEAVEFACGCDLLLCDGQFSDEEFRARPGSGHNAWTAAARFGSDCGARMTRIVHHDPTHTDDVLSAADRAVQAFEPSCRLAREGERIAL